MTPIERQILLNQISLMEKIRSKDFHDGLVDNIDSTMKMVNPKELEKSACDMEEFAEESNGGEE